MKLKLQEMLNFDVLIIGGRGAGLSNILFEAISFGVRDKCYS